MLMTLSILAMSVLALGAQAPADWDKTSLRAMEWITEGKAAQAVALLERTVAQAPGFEVAKYELARAHLARAGELSIQQPSPDVLRRRHLEQAATFYRKP